MPVQYRIFSAKSTERLLRDAILAIQSSAEELRVDVKEHPERENCIQKLVSFSQESSRNTGSAPVIDVLFAKWLVCRILSKKY